MMNDQSKKAQAIAQARQHAGSVVMELLFNFVLPFAVYDLSTASLGKVGALMASSAPPILWSIYGFIRQRKVDAISVLVVGGILLSLLAFLGGGGVKFLQLRENLVTGLVGLVFLASAAIGKPLMYQLAKANLQRRASTGLEAFESRSQDAGFRRTMALMTLVWGSGLVASCAVNCVLVFSISIKDYLLVSPPVGYVTMGLLFAWTFWYGKRARRRGEALRAEQTQDEQLYPADDTARDS